MNTVQSSSPDLDSEALSTKQLDHFVSLDWLEQHLQEKNQRIIQLDGDAYYHRFHIPGALQVAYAQITAKVNGVPGMRAETQQLALVFGQLGIDVATRVIAYDMTGGLDAARLIWTLASLGHRGGGAVLNGGFSMWYNEKRPMESGRVSPSPTVFHSELNPAWEADWQRVLAVAEGKIPAILVDTRTSNEYLGLTVRPPKGYIGDAVHFDWVQSLVDPKIPLLKDDQDLRNQFAKLGITDLAREIIVYCESGHRASQTWLLLRHLGFKDVRLFAGSMAEWRVRDLPVKRGNLSF